MKPLALLLALAACGHEDPEPKPEPEPLHWPADRDCDGLLWAGLAAAAGEDVDLLSARDSTGTWHRRPVAYGECFPKEAQSTISRDMFVGLLAGLVEQGDEPTIDSVLRYAFSHAGVMGQPWPGDGRVQWTPNLEGAYARAATTLGGTEWAAIGTITPLILSPIADDYELHLQLIQLATEKRLAGSLGPVLQAHAEMLADANPNDALAQAVAGRSKRATQLLLDPNYQLPSYVRGPARAGEIHKAYAAKVSG